MWFLRRRNISKAADIGTLQRLPKVVGNDSLVRELAYTARNMYADEALKLGLVSSVLDTRQLALDAAFVSISSAIVSLLFFSFRLSCFFWFF